MKRAQTSIEYLLLLGGIVVIVMGVGVLMLSSISSPQPQVHCSFSSFGKLVPLGSYEVNIDSPTACAPRTYSRGMNNNVPVGFSVGEKVNGYRVEINNSADTSTICSSNPPEQFTQITPSGTTPQTSTFLCNFPGPDNYILRATATNSENSDTKTDVEVGAIIIT